MVAALIHVELMIRLQVLLEPHTPRISPPYPDSPHPKIKDGTIGYQSLIKVNIDSVINQEMFMLTRKFALFLAVFVVLLSVGFACGPGDVEADLGQEFSLAIGQKAIITGEDLEIRFEEVSEDSRCPRDVVCVWEGRVACVLEITRGGVPEEITLTQPGLTDQPAREYHQGYIFTFNVEPYPEEAEKPIKSSEYRLRLTLTSD